MFQVKSVDDKKYGKGKGKEIEKDMFAESKDYVRHFFSKEYVKELLNDYELVYLDNKKIANGNAYLDVISKKE